MIHNCLKCAYSHRFTKPISATTGNHLHQFFDCVKPFAGYTNAYGQPLSKSECLIIDLVTMSCWVDGSSNIPVEGCPNFERSEIVNQEVE